MTPEELADKIEALAARATPGPWKSHEFGPGSYSIASEAIPNTVAVCRDEYTSGYNYNPPPDATLANVELITLLGSHLPAIVQALRSCEDRGNG